ncbi:MAG: MGDG synthase family glycosyltransferase [Micromonosporaceae bacterium]
MRKRALLLPGSLGMGHDVMAEAWATSLRSRGWSTRTMDAMRLLGRTGGSAGETVFRSMLAIPGLYDAYHFATLRTGNRLARLTDAAARSQLVPRLRQYLDANPADLVVSVFATAASAVSRIHGRYPDMAHVVFCTDVTPHRLWVHKHTDLYLVTSHVAECAVQRFDPEAEIAVVPAPVRPTFYDPPTQEEARARFGVPATERCVLIMSGAWGLGPLATTAAALSRAGLHVLAVAGRNAKLEHRLREAGARHPRLHPFGFTDRVPDLMAASDLVITTSGDTCTEARVVGRHVLLLDVVPGHGRDNLQHELELGGASVTSARPADVVRTTLSALDHVKPAPSGATRTPADWETALTAALTRIGLGSC